MNNDSEQSYEVSNLVFGIAGSVCAPIACFCSSWCGGMCIQGIQDHFSVIDLVSHCNYTLV